MAHEMWCAEVQHGEECNCCVVQKPTRKEVERIRDQEGAIFFNYNDRKIFRNILTGYLTQEEELKDLRESNARRSGLIQDLTAALGNRNAENKALCGSVQRFVRGEERACLVCGKREPCKETPEACTFEPTPMELMRENRALKEEIQRSMYHEEHLDQTYSDEEDTLP